MREIKFYGYGNNGVDGSIIKEYLYDLGVAMSHERPFALMQYTGLKDKNGKEIYEGDVLSIDDTDTPIFEVHWRRQHACFGMRRLDQDFEDNLTDWAEKAYRVIGNIYQNPELLN